METLNKEKLRKQIKEGKEISLDGILMSLNLSLENQSKQPMKLR